MSELVGVAGDDARQQEPTGRSGPVAPLDPLQPHDGEGELARLRAKVDQFEAERERLGIPIQRP